MKRKMKNEKIQAKRGGPHPAKSKRVWSVKSVKARKIDIVIMNARTTISAS